MRTTRLQEKEIEQQYRRRIIGLRQQHNLTQHKMANNLGIKLSRYQSWEEGRAFPPLHYLIQIADFFNLTIDQLKLAA